MRQINIKRTMFFLGKDLVICIHNEDGGHIGSQVIAQPYEKNNQLHVTFNIWNRLSHKDEDIAKLYAKAASLQLNQIVCCICGIHIDDIQEDEMNYIFHWCQKDIENMVKEIQR